MASVSQMTQYRKEHPEYYEAEKVRNNERMKTQYKTDPDFRQKKLEYNKKVSSTPEFRNARNAYCREKYKAKKLAQCQTSNLPVK
jgi:hypothetical protein